MTPGPRVAIYFTPAAGSALWRFGCGVLGYDSRRAESCEVMSIPGVLPVERAHISGEPARYGFHATLKAPFEIAGRSTPGDIDAAARQLARGTRRLELAGLRVTRIGSFVALTTTADGAGTQALAQRVVEHFEPLRAPLGSEDRQRRLAAGLTGRQRELMERWGYPYVEEQYRFHMTLSGKLPEDKAEQLCTALDGLYRGSVGDGGIAIDAISVLVQPERSAPFEIAARYALA